MTTQEQLKTLYETLFETYGPQHWWPGDTPFEIAVGAILTQNTNWTNVEKAINNIKHDAALESHILHSMAPEKLEALIRPAGYYRLKAKRLMNFLTWLIANGDGHLENLAQRNTHDLREELLAISGIGPETADSILLYALNRPVFVVDTYTARMATRHGLIEPPFDYHELQDLFQSNLPQDIQLFKEFHALIVQIGKNFCKPKPKCDACPLNGHAHEIDGER
ncbi:MAG: endonuclease III domain-containing protein [Phycisphaerae bacterium]|nr:endonuclease III domain-containing protein [Phycisphaerae bacterium]